MIYSFRMKCSGVQVPIGFDHPHQAQNWYLRIKTQFPKYAELVEPISIEITRKIEVLHDFH